MSPIGKNTHEHERRFPRVSGDEPLIPALRTPRALFSPRERG